MANSTVAHLTAVLQMNNTKFKAGISGSKKALTGFQKQVKAVGGMIAGAFAVSSIVNFTKSTFQALDVQRKAEASLLTALKGKEDAYERLTAQAKELQKITLFSDEQTIRAQALAASMGLTEDRIKKLIPAAQNLSVATGMTLDGAVKNLVRTFGGLTGELGEAMPALRELTQEELKAGKAIDLVNDLMGGQAEAAAKADTSLTQLKNKWGDLKEEIASFILDFGIAIKEFGEGVKSFTDKRSDFEAMSTFINKSMWDSLPILGAYRKQMEAIAAATEKYTKAAPLGPGSMGGKSLDTSNMFPYRASPSKALGYFQPSGMGNMQLDIMDMEMVPKIKEVIDVVDDVPNLWEEMLGLEWDEDEKPHERIKRMRQEMQYLKNIGDTFHPIEKDIKGLSGAIDSLGVGIATMLISNFDKLGEAMGNAFKGAETGLKQLGITLMQNLGYMLMYAGFAYAKDTGDWKGGLLIMLGGAQYQLGAGIFKSNFEDKKSALANEPSHNVQFKIKGNDLVSIMRNTDIRTNYVT